MKLTIHYLHLSINYLLLTTLFVSCGEALMDYQINTDMPVVESYLQEGATNLSVNVYSMEVYLEDDYQLSKPVTGLKMTINGTDLTETSSGTYTFDMGEDTIRENQKYDLRFDYKGTPIEASTTVPAPIQNLRVDPEIVYVSSNFYWGTSDTTEVIVTWDDPYGSYYQIFIDSPNTSDAPSIGVFGRRMMQPFKGNSYKTTTREFRSTGSHWINVYRIDKDYADLYERVSASDLANPVSSIQNAFGIFTSMSVARVRVIAYQQQ